MSKSTRTKKEVKEIVITKKNGKRLNLEEIMGLVIWANVSGFKINNKEDK